MTRIAILASYVVLLLSGTGQADAVGMQTDQHPAQSLVLPAGTKIELAVTSPVWARTAKAGDNLYTQADFPVIIGNSVAIPAGTYVQGTIQSITRPSRFRGRAEIQVLLTTLIFGNGYIAQLPSLPSIAANAQSSADQSSTNLPLAPTLMKLSVDVSASSDVLIDNGAQFDAMLGAPLLLDSNQVKAARTATRPVDLAQLKSASMCRPTPGTPGTPGTSDTVIPGSPGTPDTTIPGGPGMPDTVIPGTPATPPTVIPGTPGTAGFPGTACPRAPIIVSSVPVNATSTVVQTLSPTHHP
jgi:hypothetical protein